MDSKGKEEWKKEVANIKKLQNTQKHFTPSYKQFKSSNPKTIQHQSTQIPTPQYSTNNLKKFQSGKISIETTLDLHGLSQDEAFDRLKDFVIRSYEQNQRALLVITGKSGILKQETPRWLSLEPLASIILSSKEARQKDGGSGALYILLRKNRL